MPRYKFTGQAKSFAPIPAGDYDIVVLYVKFGSSHAGTPVLILKVKITKTGGVCYEKLSFNEEAAWKIDTVLQALNIAPPVGTEFDFNETYATRLVGRHATVTLSNNGKYNYITSWLPWLPNANT